MIHKYIYILIYTETKIPRKRVRERYIITYLKEREKRERERESGYISKLFFVYFFKNYLYRSFLQVFFLLLA